MHHLAYVFERFPTFTQTFCVREVLELERQGLRPLIFSIRDTRSETPRHFPEELYQRVHFLPPENDLIDFIKTEKDANRLPQEIVLSLRHWGERSDKLRVYEAAYIGQKMRAAGVRHAHSHFAGVGARVGWWLKYAFDFTYSFTGHANDIFCEEPGLDLNLSRLMKEASLVVTVSDYAVRELRQRFPAQSLKIHRVYNGLDVRRYPIAHPNFESPLIFSIGRLIEKKGFHDLISACAWLKKRGHHFCCEIAGDGPLESELRAQIAQLGLQDFVTLLGAQTEEQIIERLGQTTVFALACVTEKGGGKDNLPTVLMEAMAASVPCVATNVAGIPEMVENGITGFLVEEGRPEEFGAAIEQVLRGGMVWTHMSSEGFARASDLFSLWNTASRLMRLFLWHGLTRFDPALVIRQPALVAPYLRQACWRAVRLARFKRLRHRRAPDFVAANG
ncbi:MAG: glycosyltransferase family 4 protein [Verrucomicrobiales bacterium]